MHPQPYLVLSLLPFSFHLCHDPCPTHRKNRVSRKHDISSAFIPEITVQQMSGANLVLSTPFLLLFISASLFITVPLFISLFVPVLPVAIMFTASTAVTSVSFTIPRGEECPC